MDLCKGHIILCEVKGSEGGKYVDHSLLRRDADKNSRNSLTF
jgi:hypothetical protein